VWDAETGSLRRALRGHTGSIRTVAFAAAGRQALSVSDDGSLRLWDVRTGDELHSFTDERRRPQSMVLAVQGDVVVTGDLVGLVRRYDFGEAARLIDLTGRLGAWPMESAASTDTPDGWLARGAWFAWRGACAWAKDQFERASAAGRKPDPSEAMTCAWHLGDREEARRELLRQVREHPGAASEAWIALALRSLGERPPSTVARTTPH
jgi:hypothetical protein